MNTRERLATAWALIQIVAFVALLIGAIVTFAAGEYEQATVVVLFLILGELMRLNWNT